MAAVPYPLTPGPTGAGDLIARLSRPGVCSAQIEFAGPSTGFIVPANASRVYLAFSLASLGASIIVTPGSTDIDCGYLLHANESIIEFGGGLISSLIAGQWLGTSDSPAFLNVTVVNRE